MDPAEAFSSFFRDLLTRFSDRCVEQLTGRSTSTLPLSITREHLAENVEKEVVKDRDVIEQAVTAHARGARLADEDIDALWERSQQVDQDFVRNMVLPSVSIQLHFDDIREIRKRRFRYLAAVVDDLLQSLRDGDTLDDAFQALYTADQFHGFVSELLFLHRMEVKKLAASVRFLPPFNRAMDMFIDEVVESMETTRHIVAAAETRRLFPAPATGKKRRVFA
jgi:hypothetical protein